jgi:two-component system cell cycle sensor histidine kinase/response regulator CckA
VQRNGGVSPESTIPKIVVVDAEPAVRSTVSTILRRAGYFVQAAGEFEKALRIVESLRPDLVLTNVFLNGVSGRDAIRELKSRYPGLRVLMVSGLPDDEAIRELTKTDRFDVFPKPYKASDLIAKVKQVLQD